LNLVMVLVLLLHLHVLLLVMLREVLVSLHPTPKTPLPQPWGSGASRPVKCLKPIW